MSLPWAYLQNCQDVEQGSEVGFIISRIHITNDAGKRFCRQFNLVQHPVPFKSCTYRCLKDCFTIAIIPWQPTRRLEMALGYLIVTELNYVSWLLNNATRTVHSGKRDVKFNLWNVEYNPIPPIKSTSTDLGAGERWKQFKTSLVPDPVNCPRI